MKVRDLLDQYSITTVYYMALLPRHAETSQHRTDVHQNCMVQNRCLAGDNTIQDLSGSHHTAGCSCESRGPDMDHVTRIIGEGGIPLVAIRRDEKGTLVLEIVAAKPGIRYTAISHVWVDGLGNASLNVLPECWIEELKARLDVQEKDRRTVNGHASWGGSLTRFVITFPLAILFVPLSWTFLLAALVMILAFLSSIVGYLGSQLRHIHPHFPELAWLQNLFSKIFSWFFTADNLTWWLFPGSSKLYAWTMDSMEREKQLRRFFHLTQPVTYFWIDVFCIPAPTDARNIALKTRAIQRMVPTYVGATSVLVFDKNGFKARYIQG